MATIGSWNADIIIEVSDSLSFRLDGRNIAINGIVYDNSVTASNDFSIGNVVIPKLTLKLLNYNGEFDRYGAWNEDSNGHYVLPEEGDDGTIRLDEDVIWEGSTIYRCNASRVMEDGTTKSQSLGSFTVQEAVENGGIITITAYGLMDGLDEDYDSEGSLTLQALYTACCQKIDATADAFPSVDFTISTRPSDCTWREVLSAVVQLVGRNVLEQSSVDGSCRLSLVSYDESEVDSDVTMMSMQSREKNPISVTGVKASYTSGQVEYNYIRGEDSFCIDISDNLLLKSELQANESAVKEDDPSKTFDPSSILKRYVDQVAGYFLTSDDKPTFSYTPFSGSFVSAPGILPGQTVRWKDRKGHSQKGIAMNVTLTCGGSLKMSSSSPQKIDKRKSAIQAAIAQGSSNAVYEAVQKSSRYEQAAFDLNKLTTNALGYYQTVEVDEQGRTTTYIHDQSTLANSTKIWKLTGQTFSLSTDGGKTYTNGVSFDGSMVMNQISVVGLSAEWIKTGILQSQNKDFYLDMNSGEAYVPRLIARAGNTPNYYGIEQGTFNLSGAEYSGMRFFRLVNVAPPFESPEGDYFQILRGSPNTYGYVRLRAINSDGNDVVIDLIGDNGTVSGSGDILQVRADSTLSIKLKLTQDGWLSVPGGISFGPSAGVGSSVGLTGRRMESGGNFVSNNGGFYAQNNGQNVAYLTSGGDVHGMNVSAENGTFTNQTFSNMFKLRQDGLSLFSKFDGNGDTVITCNYTNKLVIGWAEPTSGGETTIYRIAEFGHDYTTSFHGNLNMNGYSILNQSDRRLKKYITDSKNKALPIIEAIPMRQYTYKVGAPGALPGKKVRFGQIAQELYDVYPEAVVHDEDKDEWYIDKMALIDPLIKAVQELSAKVTALEEELKQWRETNDGTQS